MLFIQGLIGSLLYVQKPLFLFECIPGLLELLLESVDFILQFIIDFWLDVGDVEHLLKLGSLVAHVQVLYLVRNYYIFILSECFKARQIILFDLQMQLIRFIHIICSSQLLQAFVNPLEFLLRPYIQHLQEGHLLVLVHSVEVTHNRFKNRLVH